jgi:hypothetical protein
MAKTSPLEAALHYASQGVPVLPLHHIRHDGTCSCGQGGKCKPGKHPVAGLVRHGLKDASTDHRTIRQWFGDQRRNIGICTGPESGFFVLDCDYKDGGEQGLKDLQERGGSLPGTLAQRTGAGKHLFFRYPADRVLKNSAKKLGQGLDIRADGGYVVAAPSTHVSGNRYAWIDCDLPDFSQVAVAPSWLVDLIEKEPERTHSSSSLSQDIAGGLGSFSLPDLVMDGEGRENTILRAAGHLRGKGVDQGLIEQLLLAYNQSSIVPPLDEREVLDRARRYSPPIVMTGDWPEPRPLPGALPSVKPFDFDMLPDALRDAVEDAAELMQAPPDFLAVSCMVAATAALGLTVSVAPKARDNSWLVPPILWGALIGAPSTKKTPCLSMGMAPLQTIELQLNAAHEAAMRGHHQDLANHEDQVKLARKSGQPIPPKPNEPPPERLVINDATYQAVGVALQGSPRGVVVCMDELTGWLTSMESSSQEAARAFYLTAWNGTDPYRFDRIGRAGFVINPLAVSVLGGIQPDRLEEYTRQAVQGRGDDGLLQRFQLAVYPDPCREWKHIDRAPDYQAREEAAQAILRLRDVTAQQLAARYDPAGRAYLNFDDAAQGVFNQAYQALEAGIRKGNLEPVMEAHLGKYPRMIAVLALVIHLVDGGGGAIGINAVRKAIRWGAYLRSHANRIYGSSQSKGNRTATAIAEKMRSGKLCDGFTRRDIKRKGWHGLSNDGQVEAGLDILVEHGWLRDEHVTGAQRHTTKYFINPQVRRGA